MRFDRVDAMCAASVGVLVACLVIVTVASDLEPVTGEAARDKPYVASVCRQPYHRADCRWAKKVSPVNLRGHDSPEAAIAAGHRPCRVCRPDQNLRNGQ